MPYRPPYWYSRNYGEAYGAWKPPPKVDRKLPLLDRVAVPDSRLLDLEDEIRSAVLQHKPGYEVAKTVLLRAFQEVDTRASTAAKLRREQRAALFVPAAIKQQPVDPSRCSGKVSVSQFIAAMSKFGVVVTPAEATGLFGRHGTDEKGRHPYEVFTSALFAGQAKVMAWDQQRHEPLVDPTGGFGRDPPPDKWRPVPRGRAVSAPAARTLTKTALKGAVHYRYCRTPVYAPSNFSTAQQARSAAVPEASLELEFVYGYNGLDNTASNLFYLHDDRVVYYTAGVAIVLDPKFHMQEFYLGHDDDIKCMCIHPDRNLVASGQVGKNPFVSIWEAETLMEVARITMENLRSICAVQFSPDGKYIIVVCTDNAHTLTIWDWRRSKKLFEGSGKNGEPTQVYGAAWNPKFGGKFITWGKKHLKVWCEDGQQPGSKEREFSSQVSSFGESSPYDVLCACWLDENLIATGNKKGLIGLWDSNSSRNINHVDTGSKRPVSWLKAVPTADQLCLFSGGADGCITEWKVSGKKIARVRVTRIGEQDVPTIRAFDIHPTAPERRVIVGTAQCDLFEVSDGASRLLIDGHMAPLFGCCAHPTDPNVFVTACESSRCFIFDAQRKFVSRTVGLPGLCRSVAISPDGQQLAVGLKDGQLCVMWFESLERVARTHLMKEAIDALKFSPDGQFLAVGSHDNYIDIYETRSYKRLSRCTGHSSYITHLDWSADSKLIRSTCGAYELLYWSMPKSVRVTAEQRDTVWATNTCVLGFSVMGIWPDYSDGTDVNAVDTDKQNSVVVTADDYGQVKLFNFPCVVDDAPHKLYKGHSSHVMCVRFLAGASRVISVGGPDRAVFQWRATNIRQPAAALPKPEVHARAVRDKTSAAKQAQIRIYRGDENKENRHLPKLASKGQPAGNPGCLGPQGGGGTRPGWWG